ncbi:hypothetical protein [Stutzerimonas stutzeri]|nr:hypothetical protein [Stutzerimonas stutzeri]
MSQRKRSIGENRLNTSRCRTTSIRQNQTCIDVISQMARGVEDAA